MAKEFTRTNFKSDDFIYPYFVRAGVNKKEAISSFPGVFRLSIDNLLKDIAVLRELGIKKILLFGVLESKDILGSQAYKKNNLIVLAIKEIKRKFNDLIIFTDICLCSYTSHGHCGALNRAHKIDTRKTQELLAQMALSHAQAGADWVSPSAMVKNQVLIIRNTLDKNGFKKTKIMGYSAKFASNFYGPFRAAAGSAPQFGDRRAYQLDYCKPNIALKEIAEDIKEGADMVMVKPALAYLDIIQEAKRKFNFPLAAYNVSGEYAFVKYGSQSGLWDGKEMTKEILTAIKRAGAKFIITYHAKEVAQWLKEKDR